jgi:Ribonuclease HII
MAPLPFALEEFASPQIGKLPRKERWEAHAGEGGLSCRARAVGSGKTRVAGVDEVGVGALAGPVIAAAVIFRLGIYLDGLADSKMLRAKRRKVLFTKICECGRRDRHWPGRGGGS